MQFTSPAFQNNEIIPTKYTCDGENISPPFHIEEVPENAQSLVLIMHDPDVPAEVRDDQNFDHWVLFNIPPSTGELAEGTDIGDKGQNTRGDNGYTGPCPPPQYEPREHRYFFKLYALDSTLKIPEGATREEVEEYVEIHMIEEAELIGRYARLT
jgi:Raf kinase inhibitor-like YbhB/YbcL family protein